MRHFTKSVLVFVSLLIGGVIGGVMAQSASEPQTDARGIDRATLQKRYQIIWDNVGKVPSKVPPMVVHLGASAGNRITVWAKSVNGRNAATRDWVLACEGADALSVEEEVHDPRFGVSKLAITRNDGNAASLPCRLSMVGSSAPLVIPVLSPLPDQRRFSFLAYSCNEPFTTKGRKGILARDLSLWMRMDARAKGEDSRGQLPTRPQFVLGVGDQIYVDPDADAKGTERLSLFTGKRSEAFLIRKGEDSLYGALDDVYRFNFSLPPLADALSKLPSYMMWDDHEIRDGWGSQGDELTDPDMIAYFRVARHAFIAHQLLRSYAPGEFGKEDYKALVDGGDTLHRPFSHGERTHVLMLDSRSKRARGSEIFEETARRHVDEWLGRGRKDQGDLYVLAVGTPLFPSRNLTGLSIHELDDDLRDSWDSPQNEKSRDELLKLLANHFGADKQDRLLVISGDVHYSSLYFLSLNGRVVGQEVVTSGIAHSLPWEGSSFNWLIDSGNEVGQFGVMPAGKINDSASFAELIVDLGEKAQPPKVDLVFHLNGTRVKGGVALGNTNLLVPRDRPLWYHTYRYDYRDPLEHLDAARREAYPLGDIPAGSIMPLPLKLPSVRTRRRLILWPFGRNVVQSAIQGQSVFCVVEGTDYNKTLATSWDLADPRSDLKSNCVPLKR